MSDETAHQRLYRPIKSYQTRILELAGDLGDPHSRLVGSLYDAHILHERLGGFSLRGRQQDRNVVTPYEALSYTWGNDTPQGYLRCNHIYLPIGENLLQALKALRHAGEKVRYLWVDAICINQKDKLEKATQIPNMMTIYQSAFRVVTWLGEPCHGLEAMLDMVKYVKKKQAGEQVQRPKPDMAAAISALKELYEQPYFQRIWVQQEVFSAREITVYCGKREFSWSGALADPRSIWDSDEELRRWATRPLRPVIDRRTNQERTGFLADENLLDFVARQAMKALPTGWKKYALKKKQAKAVSELIQLHDSRLRCFETFYSKRHHQEGKKLELIPTLLDTGILNATVSRDFIYGILGICDIPSRAMSLEEWMNMGVNDDRLSIPINCSVDLATVLTILTWLLVMKGGLRIIAKFKVVVAEGQWDTRCEQTLPSWVVDWRLAARMFKCREPRLRDMFDRCGHAPIHDSWNRLKYVRRPRRFDLVEMPAPAEQRLLCHDNSDLARVSQGKLVVRGRPDERFYADGKRIKARRGNPRNGVWTLGFDVHPSDIILCPISYPSRFFRLVSTKSFSQGGLWLLRPTNNVGEYTLLAVLEWGNQMRKLPRSEGPYSDWKWSPEEKQDHGLSSASQLSVCSRFNRFDRRAPDGSRNWDSLPRWVIV